ncbi:MAG: radical SAM protein [Candidatus Lambdaproteobacteria bacterium RIFOXYD12_FULL_49_8]|nr:MAG: radical SAM protein [Candidatus Lambdaproteobacteria bacterium RIFOXYD12_FULL_49_8]
MTDKYRIDSHKLLFHPTRVSDWIQGKNVYPLYMEISPTGGCNHRCTYCALDFMGYEKRNLDTAILKARLKEMAGLGLKSVMYAGEGEPFLHPDMVEITQAAKAYGIDNAFTTNATKIDQDVAEAIMPVTSWIKVSINGSTKETYAKIHRSKPADYDTVIANMAYCGELKRKNKLDCALGMQLLLLPENQHEAVDLAKLAKKIGMDYLVIKPYSQHPLSKTHLYENVTYDNLDKLSLDLQAVSGDGFSVIYRRETMATWDHKAHEYGACLALPFWSYMDAGGNIWGCSMYMESPDFKERFLYGNINEQSFEEIWNSKKRLDALAWVQNELDVSNCRVNCRMDKVNKYLWELKHPAAHVNFI